MELEAAVLVAVLKIELPLPIKFCQPGGAAPAVFGATSTDFGVGQTTGDKASVGKDENLRREGAAPELMSGGPVLEDG